MKKIISFLCVILALSACNDKQEAKKQEMPQQTVTLPADADKITFTYKKDTLPDSCQIDSEIICAIETAVKCALDPNKPYCDSKTLPDFIFYDDAMFAEGDVLGRPSEQSFKLIKIKPIDATTIEVFTHGECNSNWFGSCEGNIIYVLSNKSGHWLVREIYAIEHI